MSNQKKTLFLFLFLLFCSKVQSQNGGFTVDKLSFSKYNCDATCNLKYEICFSDFFVPDKVNITVIIDPSEFQFCEIGDFTYKGNGVYVIEDYGIPQDGIWCAEFTGTALKDIVSFKTIITNSATGNTMYQSSSVYNPNTIPISGKVSDLIASGNLLPLNLALQQSQQKQVCGTLIVDTDYQFSTSNGSISELEFCPDSKIIINSGNSLTLSKTKLFSCNDTWEGIVVDNGGTVDMYRCYVINAQKGILAQNGAEVLTIKNQFEANAVGIELGNEVENNISTLLVGNIFTGNSNYTLNTPLSSKTGMRINNVLDPVVLKSNAGWVPKYHYFGDLTNGVLVEQGGDVIVDKPIMVNISSFGIKGTGSPIAAIEVFGTFFTTFDNVNSAIDLTNTQTNVHDCSFLNNIFKGIQLNFDDAFNTNKGVNYINNNRIEAYGNSILIKNQQSRGIISENIIIKKPFPSNKIPFLSNLGHAVRFDNPNPINNNASWIIQNNPLISMVKGASTIHLGNVSNLQIRQNEQIENVHKKTNINVAGGHDNLIDCNGITSGERGISINGSFACRVGCNDVGGTQPLSFSGACADTRTLGNTLGAGLSLFYNSNAFSRLEKHNGNIFGGGAIHSGPASAADASKYFVEKSSNPDYYPKFINAPIFDWFNDKKSNSNFICTSDCSFTKGNITGNEGEDVRFKIRDNQIIFDDAFSLTMPWIAKKQLYDILTSEQQILSEFQAFYTQNTNNSIGRFAYLEKAYKDLFVLTQEEQNLVDKLNLGLKNIRASQKEIKLFKEKNGKETEELDRNAWEEYKNIGVSWRNTALLLRDFWNEKQTFIEGQITQLKDYNTQIVTENQAALYQKEVNHIFLHTHTNKVFSTENVNTLKTIANTCPLIGGNAVYAARATLKANELQADIEYNDNALCFTAAPAESKKSNIIANDGLIFPNPANTSFTFVRNESTEEATLVLSDLSGKIMLSKILGKYEHSIELSTENLPTGTYLLKVNSSVSSEVFKINIIK